jgi:hypothetical protein
MNKNTIISVIVVVVLAGGVWLFASRTTHQDAMTPTVSGTPVVSVSVTPSPTVATSSVTIISPKYNDVVDSPVIVTGKARVFENQFTVRLKDSTGKIVYQRDAVMSDAKDSNMWGTYSIKIPFPVGLGSNFKIEAVDYSAKGGGAMAGYASVPVKLKTTDTSNLYVGFLTSDDCSTVTLYPRQIIKSPEYVYMSLVELLKGPNSEEVSRGATNQIPKGVNINSFKLVGDTAYVDFDQILQQGVSGSCRVQAIKSQIATTLKQFLGISNVILSINGKTDGILQP